MLFAEQASFLDVYRPCLLGLRHRSPCSCFRMECVISCLLFLSIICVSKWWQTQPPRPQMYFLQIEHITQLRAFTPSSLDAIRQSPVEILVPEPDPGMMVIALICKYADFCQLAYYPGFAVTRHQ